MIRQNVESSNVASVGHADTTLEVEFKHGGVYRYYNVSAEKFEALMAADSIGKYLNAEIKPHHGFELVNPNDPYFHLIDVQRQLDADGVEVGVSRQALDWVLAELEYLRYFYGAAGDAFGPADSDVYYGIAEDFLRRYGYPPPGSYDPRTDDEA